MNIQENIPLRQYTTFKIGGPARFFCSVADEGELLEAVRFAHEKALPVFILGGGSNLLISDKGFSGLVIKMDFKGIEYREESNGSNENKGTVIVSAAAGETWDDFVEQMVARGLYGVENLSAIPGMIGAVPVQNIGAYGAEASQVIKTVRILDTTSLSFKELRNAGCHFAYRDSVFKHLKGRYIITRVDFELSKNGKVNTSYKDVADYFAAKRIAEPSLEEVRKAIIDIRWNKLPDWKLWGTAGSFFKNPVISAEHFAKLRVTYPELPGYPEPDGRVKVSLGWILDKICNVKGLSRGHVSTYEKQALVIVAQPGATADEVVELTHELMKRVKEKTDIEIEAEVEWVN